MKNEVMTNMGLHYSSKAFTARPGKGLPMEPQSSSESDDDEDEIAGEKPEDAKRRKEKKKAQRAKQKGKKHDKYARAN
jgi:hypothetical protein